MPKSSVTHHPQRDNTGNVSGYIMKVNGHVVGFTIKTSQGFQFTPDNKGADIICKRMSDLKEQIASSSDFTSIPTKTPIKEPESEHLWDKLTDEELMEKFCVHPDFDALHPDETLVH